MALEFVRWNSNASSEMEFSSGDCVGIQVALVSAERFSERKAIALGAIQNPLDVIYITAKTVC